MASLLKCFYIRKSRCKTRNQVDRDRNREDVDACATPTRVSRYRLSDMERLTSGFSQVIGTGGYGIIYKGCLPDSTPVALKVHLGGERLNQVFQQELDILISLSHPNIVKLLGYCEERDEGVLMFEYIPNGNLQEKLHGSSGAVLPWGKRLTLALQLCKAIEYLHEKCSPQIVHGDVKASNILLDRHHNCKLCDLGSAKKGFSSTVVPPTMPPRSKHVMIGSPGYTDPHYLRTGIASKKNDIYSLGVVMLELISGKEVFCHERVEMLTATAAPLLANIMSCEADVPIERIVQFVDPRLGGKFELEEAKAMLLISAMCLRQPPSLRPSATQVLQNLRDRISSLSLPLSPVKDLSY